MQIVNRRDERHLAEKNPSKSKYVSKLAKFCANARSPRYLRFENDPAQCRARV
jgi:hypothetical protein